MSNNLPQPDFNRYQFVLNNFGLQYLRPLVFQSHSLQPSKVKHDNFEAHPLGFMDMTGDTPKSTSYLGTPVFDNVNFPGTSWQDDSGKVHTTGDLQIDAVLISVDQQRNIVKTPLAGRDGTVKEYISNGDYSIGLTGVLTSADGGKYFPQSEYQILQYLCEAPVAMPIQSGFLGMLNIHSVVIESFSVSQKEGYPFIVPFTIKMTSDKILELQLIQDKQS